MKHLRDYTIANTKRIKALASCKYKDEKVTLSHILPRAFCIAKPASSMAVFVVPTCDREPQVAADAYAVVQNETASEIQVGDWAVLAYVSRKHSGMVCVINRLTIRHRGGLG